MTPTLKPGWLANDVARAAARVDEWKGKRMTVTLGDMGKTLTAWQVKADDDGDFEWWTVTNGTTNIRCAWIQDAEALVHLLSAYDAVVADRERLLNLYEATVSGARKERERYEAWSADDKGKQVLTPAGFRALEDYDAIRTRESEKNSRIAELEAEAAQLKQRLQCISGTARTDDGGEVSPPRRPASHSTRREDVTALKDLEKRLEEATGPNFAIERDLLMNVDSLEGDWSTPPAYTSSLDAAIALCERVLGKSDWDVDCTWSEGERVDYSCTLWPDQGRVWTAGDKAVFAGSKSPALALCLATVRALIAKGGASD